MKDEKGNITINTNKIQSIIAVFFENLYSSELES
jgi:hypothetical protein